MATAVNKPRVIEKDVLIVSATVITLFLLFIDPRSLIISIDIGTVNITRLSLHQTLESIYSKTMPEKLRNLLPLS